MSYRKDFEENYVAVPAAEGDSRNRKKPKVKYLYCGPWYFWDLSEKERKKCGFCLTAAGFLNTVIYLAAGVQYADVNTSVLVFLPLAASCVALLFEWVGIVQFCIQKEKMTAISWQSIMNYLKIAPFVQSVGMVLAVIFCVYYMVTQTFSMRSLAVTVGYGVCALLAAYVVWKIRSLPFHSEKNPLRRQIREQQAAQEEKNQELL